MYYICCLVLATTAAGCKVDDVAILALLAHLPRQQATGQQHVGTCSAHVVQ
jgi:hypothetical protein